MYGTYLKNAKFVSEFNSPSISLMANCAVELYGLRPNTSYQFVFVYIRCVCLPRLGALCVVCTPLCWYEGCVPGVGKPVACV